MLKCLFAVFDTAWRGAMPVATSGADNTAGSTRTIEYSTAIGVYTFTEVVSAARTGLQREGLIIRR